MLYVVFTTGRTGSQLISLNITKYFNIPMYNNGFDANISSGVVHSHNPFYTPNNKNEAVAILSCRRNLFDSIISAFVADRTNEFVKYSNKVVEPFYIKPIDFEHRYNFERVYYKLINCQNFSKVIYIYYEDMMADPKHLFSQLGIDANINLSVIKKSPYRNQDLILNFDKIEELYGRLLLTPLTNSDIDSVRNSIEDDLKNPPLNRWS